LTTDTSIYLHIPFCAHRCAYCDFNTYAGQEALIPAYIDALIREIETVAALQPHPVPAHTIFFGGGTPSLVPPKSLSAVMDALRSAFALTETWKPPSKPTLARSAPIAQRNPRRRAEPAQFWRSVCQPI
jgi:coproporphyrinogen III oxidase-like Fe-S oxidoreductase